MSSIKEVSAGLCTGKLSLLSRITSCLLLLSHSGVPQSIQGVQPTTLAYKCLKLQCTEVL